MPKPYQPNDRLAQKAKQKGFRARSVFKLEELDQKFKLLEEGLTVLDLGAAPGSWLQYTSQKIGSTGLSIGIDIKPISPISSNTHTFIADVMNKDQIKNILSKFNIETVDLILSDIAPNTTGIKYVNQKRSVELNKAIVEIAKVFLKPEGKLVMKVFSGEDLNSFIKNLKSSFKNVSVIKVEASRDRSKEVYVLCQ